MRVPNEKTQVEPLELPGASTIPGTDKSQKTSVNQGLYQFHCYLPAALMTYTYSVNGVLQGFKPLTGYLKRQSNHLAALA
jgi:hypothetical protein